MGETNTFTTRKKSPITSTENYCIAKVRLAEIKSSAITCVISLLRHWWALLHMRPLGINIERKQKPATFLQNFSDAGGHGWYKSDS